MLPAAGTSPISEITPVPSKADINDVEPAQSPTGEPPVLLCIADLLLCSILPYKGLQGTGALDVALSTKQDGLPATSLVAVRLLLCPTQRSLLPVC